MDGVSVGTAGSWRTKMSHVVSIPGVVPPMRDDSACTDGGCGIAAAKVGLGGISTTRCGGAWKR